MKVCHLADSADGAMWMVEQLRALRDEHGHEVAACLSSDRGRVAEALRAEGIPLHTWRFAGRGVTVLWTTPAVVLRLARLFRRERFDVVQTHLFRAMMVGRLAAWLADVPVRLCMVPGPRHLEARVTRGVDRATWWMDSAVIASSEYIRGLYRRLGVPDSRLELVYYGVDARRFDPARCTPADLRAEHGWPADTPLIGMVARFYRPVGRTGRTPPAILDRGLKGHEDLVRAMPAVLREVPAAKLLLIGAPLADADRAYYEQVQALVRDLGLETSVHFTGHRADVPACLQALDVAVQPSLYENFGGTIEALLMACPLVATRVGAMVESVRDGETGLLVAPADPGDLARGIVELLRDRARARRLARAGRALVLEAFTLGRTARALSELYARRRPPPRQSYRLPVSAGRLLALFPLGAALALRTLAETAAFRIWDGLRARRRPA